MGSIPTGYGAYPDWVGLLLGIVVTCILTMLLTVPIDGDKEDPISRVLALIKIRRSKKEEEEEEGSFSYVNKSAHANTGTVRSPL